MIIDLHEMTRSDAIRFFIDKYNQIYKEGYRGQIEVIHGYGSSGKGGVIKKEFRTFLNKHSNYLAFELDANPGVTYVFPKKAINSITDLISQEIVFYCSDTPRSLEKIKSNFFIKYKNAEITSCVRKLVRQGFLVKILKKNGDVYKSKEVV